MEIKRGDQGFLPDWKLDYVSLTYFLVSMWYHQNYKSYSQTYLTMATLQSFLLVFDIFSEVYSVYAINVSHGAIQRAQLWKKKLFSRKLKRISLQM